MNINKIIKEELNKIISEEIIKLQESSNIYNIASFKNVFKRIGYDDMSAETLKNMTATEFKKGGDNAVANFIEKVLGIRIYPISRGRYMFQEPTKEQ